MTKPKLIIVSDLWGIAKSPWIADYVCKLESKFSITLYDCCQLAEVNPNQQTEENIHNQFLNTGINQAVFNLLALEKEKTSILAFSMGGTIAWKALLKGLNTPLFVAISATRLRYETQVPNCKILLYFGANDPFKPDQKWFKKNVTAQILDKKKHQLYQEPLFISQICNMLLAT